MAIRDTLRYLIASGMLLAGIAGLAAGGGWNWLGVVSFVLVLVLDVGLSRDEASRSADMNWVGDLVLYLPLALIATLWLLFAHHLASAPSLGINTIGAALSVAFLSAFGGLPPSHELMHRNGSFDRFYASLYLSIFLLPMSDLGHVHGHHLNVATVDDYDTPRRGESVYTFAFKSLWCQMLDSFAMERGRLHKLNKPIWSPGGRFSQALITVFLWLGMWFYVAGLDAAPYYIATMATFFLVLGGFNYTQHYGLLRVVGKPIEIRHSWNQLKPLSRALSFEISNHSEHHLAPAKPFNSLRPQPQGPQMPSSVLCFFTAYFPPLWARYIARPRLEKWDRDLANAAELELALEANQKAGWSARTA